MAIWCDSEGLALQGTNETRDNNNLLIFNNYVIGSNNNIDHITKSERS